MEVQLKKQPGLFTAVGIGVGCIIGSGWLFSAYYAAKYIGPASFISWIIGAVFALILALLLAEISGMFRERALFSRLLTISHDNPDFGFVIAISGWLGLVIVIPTEASATVQYLSTAFPLYTKYIFVNEQHTLIGTACIIFLVLIYSMINFWGIRTLAKVSNILAVFKIVIPVITALLLMVASFHPANLTSQGFLPYGTASIFEGVMVCGIFYAFYGFAMIAMYSKELKNPQKNIPRALILSVLICFVIYMLLQAAFIVSLPPAMVAQGWSSLNFTSPFAQLLILLDMHLLSMWTIALYIDSTVSPSGTAIIYLGSAGRTVTGMAHDKQFPSIFKELHPVYRFSRSSLIFTTFICCVILLFFKSWQELMVLVSVFQIISCIAIPVAFIRLRKYKPELTRVYRTKLGGLLSYAIYLLLSYLIIQADELSLLLALVLHVLFFIAYTFTYYQRQVTKVIAALYSSWSIFLYLIAICLFGYINQRHLFNNGYVITLFILSMSGIFGLLINQKNHN